MGDRSPEIKIISIGGRMLNLRERCMGMTDIERRWRAQYLKDLQLSHGEPRNVPELYKDTTNIFRRLWKTPMWKLETALIPTLGAKNAGMVRYLIGLTFKTLIASYVLTYYWKYHTNNWQKCRSWEIFTPRPRMFPDEPGYPNYKQTPPEEYFMEEFLKSPYAIKIEQPPEPPRQPPKIIRDGVEVVCTPGSEKRN